MGILQINGFCVASGTLCLWVQLVGLLGRVEI